MKIQKTVNIKNKRATFDYEILERLVAGICLVGTEIKSLRLGKANLSDSFCYFEKSELYVRNLSISEYDYGTHYNHIAKRERKLLLEKKEIRKWERKIKENGLTIIPLRLFINDRGLAKMEIGLAKGKKNYDKRESLKLKDAKREMDRKKRF
ncbi:MAG: SsrA-binding protein [Prolixibacteraceae bacterium]|jgi:SsrA-binding protein|nr:SsrA-binding protein [Prolixibacteraceae bacterium]